MFFIDLLSFLCILLNNISPHYPMTIMTPILDTDYVRFELEDDLLIATYKKGKKITLEVAQQIVRDRMEFTEGRTVLVLLQNQGVISFDKAARDYLALQGGYQWRQSCCYFERHTRHRYDREFSHQGKPPAHARAVVYQQRKGCRLVEDEILDLSIIPSNMRKFLWTALGWTLSLGAIAQTKTLDGFNTQTTSESERATELRFDSSLDATRLGGRLKIMSSPPPPRRLSGGSGGCLLYL